MKLSAPIHILKSRAKQLSQAQSIPLNQALDAIAVREGFNSWSLLQSKRAEIYPRTYSDVLNFFNPGDLVIIGARPGVGKTTFATGLFVQAVQSRPIRHIYFSFYDVQRDIAERIARYDDTLVCDGSRFGLDDSDNICADYIIERIRTVVQAHSLVIIDYLQLLDQKRAHSDLSTQVADLKKFARQTGCVILFISQMHREIEVRTNKKPRLDDIWLPNPLDLKLFNKIVLLHRDASNPTTAKVLLAKPEAASFNLDWNSTLGRFEQPEDMLKR